MIKNSKGGLMKKASFVYRLRIGIIRNWKKIPIWMLNVFGILWAIIEPVYMYFPQYKSFFDSVGHYIFYGSVILAVAYAVFYRCVEPLHITISIKDTNTIIHIMFGEFFSEGNHLAIPVNEFFDSQLGGGNAQHGDIVAPNSIHGQFITKIYNSDSAKFDDDVNNSLVGVGYRQSKRIAGKNLKYPIGTTAAIGIGANKNFLFALTKTDGSSAKASADVPTMWYALQGLWKKVREHSNGLPVSVPLIGSGQSQVGLEPMHLVRLIILSILKASKNQEITKEINIVLLNNYIDKINLIALKEEWS